MYLLLYYMSKIYKQIEKKIKMPRKAENYRFSLTIPKDKEWVVRVFRTNVAKRTGRLWGVMSKEFVEALDLYNQIYDMGLTKEQAIEILKNYAPAKRREKK